MSKKECPCALLFAYFFGGNDFLMLVYATNGLFWYVEKSYTRLDNLGENIPKYETGNTSSGTPDAYIETYKVQRSIF